MTTDYKTSDLEQVKVRLQPRLAADFKALSIADRTAVVAAGLSPTGAAAALSATVNVMMERGALEKSALLALLKIWETRAWASVGFARMAALPAADVPRFLAAALGALVASNVPLERQAEVMKSLIEITHEGDCRYASATPDTGGAVAP